MSAEVVILAAGQGSRMRSTLPKVLHTLAGKTLLQWAVDAVRPLQTEKLHIVIGHGGEQVQSALQHEAVNWVEQAEQKGTGHAVAQALPDIADDAAVLITYGDVPLIAPQTLSSLLSSIDESSIAILSAYVDDPSGYGRIVRDNKDNVTAIVEHKDASAEQLAIAEINTGVLAAPAKALKRWLPQLQANNAQGEYYLTDIIAMAVADSFSIAVAHPKDLIEIQGINSRRQLQEVERALQHQRALQLMDEGVGLADAQRLDIRGELSADSDCFIDINCVFEGTVTLGHHVRIGPNCMIINSRIGDGVEIKANSIVEDADVSGDCVIGPFARLRPGSVLGNGVKVGNFVEVKKSRLADGAKVNHLSYIGDAEVGSLTNVGAGTITCNYDGVNKHKTRIGKASFIGSNTSLVAPVEIGDNATIGAGSTITGKVDDNELAVARGRQRNIQNWKRPEATKTVGSKNADKH